MALRIKKAGSVSAIKKSLKNAGGGGNYMATISKETGRDVRFLTEPDEWVEFYQHFDEVAKGYYPCSDDCPGCKDGNKPQQRYLARALDRTENKVIGLLLPATLAKWLVEVPYEKNKTLTDRDYALIRQGEGKNDTRYSAMPEAPTRLKVSRYVDESPKDSAELMGMVQEAYDHFFDSEDADDDDDLANVDEEPVSRRSRTARSGASRSTSTKSKAEPKKAPLKKTGGPVEKKRPKRPLRKA